MWYGWYVSCVSVHFTDSEYVVPQSRVFIPYPSTCSECKGPRPKAALLFLQRQQAHRCPNGKDPKNFKRFQSISSLDWDDPSFGPKTGWIFPTSPTWGLSNPLITIPSTEIIHVPAPEKSGWSISSFFPGMENQKNYYQTRKWFTMKVGNPEKQNIICIYIICMPTIFQKVRPNHWTMKQLDSGGLNPTLETLTV